VRPWCQSTWPATAQISLEFFNPAEIFQTSANFADTKCVIVFIHLAFKFPLPASRAFLFIFGFSCQHLKNGEFPK
jgi:hypothetical protein